MIYLKKDVCNDAWYLKQITQNFVNLKFLYDYGMNKFEYFFDNGVILMGDFKQLNIVILIVKKH